MKYIVRFSLNQFTSSSQATQDRVVYVPDYVRILRRGSSSWGRGDIVDIDEHFIAIANHPFTIIIRREVLAGQSDGWELEIKAEEVSK